MSRMCVRVCKCNQLTNERTKLMLQNLCSCTRKAKKNVFFHVFPLLRATTDMIFFCISLLFHFYLLFDLLVTVLIIKFHSSCFFLVFPIFPNFRPLAFVRLSCRDICSIAPLVDYIFNY